MKYLAHVEDSLGSEMISIYDVHAGMNSKNPGIWEKREYYSLWYLTPMIAKVSSTKITPHFAFKVGAGGNENSGGGESLEHDLSKKTVFDLKKLLIRMWGKEDYLIFSEVKIEYRLENGKYIPDLYARIAKENKFDYAVGSYLAIELHWKNKVHRSKQEYYRVKNIAAIEINLNKAIKYTNDLYKLQTQITRFFEMSQPAMSLHNPNFRKYFNERKKEIAETERELRERDEALSKTKAILQQQEEENKKTPPLLIPFTMTQQKIFSNRQIVPIVPKRLSVMQKIRIFFFGKTQDQ
ncbi:hypothetical protein [Pedobacter gandavensis]|uniref:hypothetical protein n=1 Tax=Pedobacter gandavensis TaxID=2679963 RepID=UPI00292DD906|nr:hypothetical protein [Pedobacter gandavensis]